MRLVNYLNEEAKVEKNYFYKGEPMESGGTSIAGKAAPGIQWLFKKEYIKEGDTMLDFGAGKYARNADWLRGKGCKVYAYDPFNSNGSEGWEDGKISNKLPKGEKFDLVFSSFVLNVVPKHIEKSILKDIKKLKFKKQYHIVRYTDIHDTVYRALKKKDKFVYKFFEEHYWKKKWGEIPEEISKETMKDFCRYGVQTSRGFQRVTDLEDSGFKKIYGNTKYKVFEKKN